MTAQPGKTKNLGHLVVSAATAAILTSAAPFGSWFIAFIMMRFAGKSFLVGMNYLAWPIIFPRLSLPVTFLLMLVMIPFFRPPYPEILSQRAFLFGILTPTIIIAVALMFATRPPENGGTLLTSGWDAFG